jgi:hypothetical protein
MRSLSNFISEGPIAGYVIRRGGPTGVSSFRTSKEAASRPFGVS